MVASQDSETYPGSEIFSTPFLEVQGLGDPPTREVQQGEDQISNTRCLLNLRKLYLGLKRNFKFIAQNLAVDVEVPKVNQVVQ